MKKFAIVCAGLLASSVAVSENIENADELICAAGRVQVCYENEDCVSVEPWELSIPDFVVIDTKEKTISTTKASGENRSSPFTTVERSEGLIYLQGFENERLFSFVIEEYSGSMTAAVARDGFSVSVFGVCTDADL
jgi:hypothetical protein